MKNISKAVSGILVASMLFTLAACGDDTKGGSRKNKKDKDIDEDVVIEVAEDFTKALKDMDFKKLKKLSTDIDEDLLDDIQSFYENNYGSYDIVLDTVKFEIDEDSLDIDDDEARIDVEYTFNGVVEIEGGDADDGDMNGEFTLKFDIEDDEALVSNADRVIDDFYDDVFGSVTYAGGVTIVDPLDYDAMDYSFVMFADGYDISPTDSFCALLSTFSFEDGVSSTNATVKLFDDDENLLYESSITLEEYTDYPIEISPADVGVDAFDEGYYEIVVSLDDYTYSDFSFISVSGSDTVLSGSNEIEEIDFESISSDDFVAPDSEMLGYMDGTVYTNDFFGVSLDLGNEVYVMTEDDLDSVGRIDERIYIDASAVFGDMNYVEGGVIICVTELCYDAPAGINFNVPNDGSTVKYIDGKEFLVSEDGLNYMTTTGNALLIIIFDANDVDQFNWVNDVVASFDCY